MCGLLVYRLHVGHAWHGDWLVVGMALLSCICILLVVKRCSSTSSIELMLPSKVWTFVIIASSNDVK